ncbi:uncharacterized protein FIBRA_08033 [Fibroporia radiculosa]|uniref:BTB domain-containing protein n=1 Tax=Fibroporia radiculosa TaxID=599839 RepID=J4H4Y5_9APHY|nr:uncharacterized protein FIBRA_08033 [Fibroporia radiculosa]CCM05799.1 predicted protein [Fibroporia radiculosa]
MTSAGRKRPRSDSATDACSELSDEPEPHTDNTEPAEQPLTRDDEFWIEDGNIVLGVEDIAFRVHKSTLSRNSGVFCDMLAVPQPKDAETCEGVPIVHLSDRADDVREVLRALYECHTYLGTGRLPFLKAAALIRLGHKYHMERIRDAALDRLKTCFPAQLLQWEAIIENSGSNEMEFDADPTYGIVVVNLARLTDTPSLLPIGLYLCCLLDMDDLVDGCHYEDGSFDQLDSEDLKRCVAGKSHLMYLRGLSIYRVFRNSVSSNCFNKQTCSATLETLLPKARKAYAAINGTAVLEPASNGAIMTLSAADVLISLMIHVNGTPGRICIHCHEMLEQRDRGRRNVVWKELPKLMQL